jgi:uncharacterized membrane protein YgdD (TMEM256/DUF423 family)
MKGTSWLVIGAVLAGAAVALGAYQAHGLQGWLERSGVPAEQVVRRVQNGEVAVRYQLFHALAFLALGQWLTLRPSRVMQTSAWILLAGLLGFSGGLYVIVFGGSPIHWAIVPSGGVLLIVGWCVAAVGFAVPGKEVRGTT